MNVIEEDFTVTTDNLTLVYKNLSDSNSLILNNEVSVWVIFLQQSQLIMTIVGIIANTGTSVTLLKNGQVSINIIIVKVLLPYRTVMLFMLKVSNEVQNGLRHLCLKTFLIFNRFSI